MRRSMKIEGDEQETKTPIAGRKTRSLYSVAELPLRRSSRINKQSDSSGINEIPRTTRSRSRSSTLEPQTETVMATRRDIRAGSETKTMTPGRITRRTRASSVTLSEDDLKASLTSWSSHGTPMRSHKRLSMAPSQPSVAEEVQDLKEQKLSSVIVIEDEISVESDSTSVDDIQEKSDSKRKDTINSQKMVKTTSESNLSNGCDKKKLTDTEDENVANKKNLMPLGDETRTKKNENSDQDFSDLSNESVDLLSRISNSTTKDPLIETSVMIVDEMKTISKIKATESKEFTESVDKTAEDSIVPDKKSNSIEDAGNDSDSEIDVCGLSNKTDELWEIDSERRNESEESDEEIDVCDTNPVVKENIERQDVVVVLEDILDKVKYKVSSEKLKQLFLSKQNDKPLERRSISEGINLMNASIPKKRSSLSVDLIRKLAGHVVNENNIEREENEDKENEELINNAEKTGEVMKNITDELEEFIQIKAQEKENWKEMEDDHGSIIPETEDESESEETESREENQDILAVNCNLPSIPEEESQTNEDEEKSVSGRIDNYDSFLEEIDQFLHEPTNSSKLTTQVKNSSLETSFKETEVSRENKSPRKVSESPLKVLTEISEKVVNSPRREVESPKVSRRNSQVSKSSKKSESSENISQEERSQSKIFHDSEKSLEVSSPIQDIVKDPHSPIQDAINDFNSPIKDAINDFNSPIKDAINDFNSPIKDAINDFNSPNKDAINDFNSPNKDAINDFNSPIKDAINGFNSPIKDTIGDSICPIKDTINETNSPIKDENSLNGKIELSKSTLISPKQLEESRKPESLHNEEESPVNFNLTFGSESETESPNVSLEKINEKDDLADEISEKNESENKTLDIPSLNKSEKEDSAIEIEDEISDSEIEMEILKTAEDLNKKSPETMSILSSSEAKTVSPLARKICGDKNSDLKDYYENSKEESLNETNSEALTKLREMSVSPKKQTTPGTGCADEPQEINESDEIVAQLLPSEELEILESTEDLEILKPTQDICESKSKEVEIEISEENYSPQEVESEKRSDSIMELEKVNFETHISSSPENRRSSIVAGFPEKQTEEDNPQFYFKDVTAEEFTSQPAKSSANLERESDDDDLILIDDEEAESWKNKIDNDSSIMIVYQDNKQSKRVDRCVSRLSVEFLEHVSNKTQVNWPPEGSLEETPKEMYEKSSEECEKSSKKSDDKSPQKIHEKSFEKMTNKTPEKIITEKSPVKIIEKTPEKITEKSPDKITEKSPEKITKKSPKKITDKSPKKCLEIQELSALTAKVLEDVRSELSDNPILDAQETDEEIEKIVNRPVVTKIEVFKDKLKLNLNYLNQLRRGLLEKGKSPEKMKDLEAAKPRSLLKPVNKILVQDFVQLPAKSSSPFFKKLDENLRKEHKRKKALPAFLMNQTSSEDEGEKSVIKKLSFPEGKSILRKDLEDECRSFETEDSYSEEEINEQVYQFMNRIKESQNCKKQEDDEESSGKKKKKNKKQLNNSEDSHSFLKDKSQKKKKLKVVEEENMEEKEKEGENKKGKKMRNQNTNKVENEMLELEVNLEKEKKKKKPKKYIEEVGEEIEETETKFRDKKVKRKKRRDSEAENEKIVETVANFEKQKKAKKTATVEEAREEIGKNEISETVPVLEKRKKKKNSKIDKEVREEKEEEKNLKPKGKNEEIVDANFQKQKKKKKIATIEEGREEILKKEIFEAVSVLEKRKKKKNSNIDKEVREEKEEEEEKEKEDKNLKPKRKIEEIVDANFQKQKKKKKAATIEEKREEIFEIETILGKRKKKNSILDQEEVKEAKEEEKGDKNLKKLKRKNEEIVDANFEKQKMKKEFNRNINIEEKFSKNLEKKDVLAKNEKRKKANVFSELNKERKKKPELISEYRGWCVEDSDFQIFTESSDKNKTNSGFQIEDIINEQGKKLEKRKKQTEGGKGEIIGQENQVVGKKKVKSEKKSDTELCVKRLPQEIIRSLVDRPQKYKKQEFNAESSQGSRKFQEHEEKNIKKTKRKSEETAKANFQNQKKKRDFDWNVNIEEKLSKKLMKKKEAFPEDEKDKNTNVYSELKEVRQKKTSDIPEHKVHISNLQDLSKLKNKNKTNSAFKIQDMINEEHEKLDKRKKGIDGRKRELTGQEKEILGKKLKLEKKTDYSSIKQLPQEIQSSSKSSQKRLKQICCERPKLFFNPKKK